jgi:hypothetical protein
LRYGFDTALQEFLMQKKSLTEKDIVDRTADRRGVLRTLGTGFALLGLAGAGAVAGSVPANANGGGYDGSPAKGRARPRQPDDMDYRG